MTSRRSFLTAAAAGSAAACSPPVWDAVAGPPAAEETGTPPPTRIDAHVHVWTPDTDAYPLAAGESVESMRPPSFRPEELFAVQRGSGVTRTVLIQMSFYGFDNRYMLDVIREHPGKFAGVAVVDLARPDLAETSRRLARQGVRGFRLYALADRIRDWGRSPEIDRVWRVAGDQGLVIGCLADPEALPAIDRMCQRFPDTAVVIDHFARIGMRPPADPEDVARLCRLARHDNVAVKTSAFYALGEKRPPYDDLAPLFRQVRDAFGAERLMWGSDCPYQVQGIHTYEASIGLIGRLPFLDAAERTAILGGTADRIYFSKK